MPEVHPEPRLDQAGGGDDPDAGLRRALLADWRAAPWRRRIWLAGVIAWLAYEWGPGNETVTPWLLARILRNTEGVAAIPVTAGIGFAFTAAQQLASGLTALAGFTLFERSAQAAWRRLRADRPDEPGAWAGLGLGARCALVFGLGTTAVALVEVMTTGRTGVRPHRSAVAAAALLCGLIVAAIGGITASLVVLGRHVDALAGPTDTLLRVLGNPLVWLGLLGVGVVVRRLRGRAAST